MSKISVAKFNEINQDWHYAKKEMEKAKEAFRKANECQLMDDCPICKGAGEIEDGYGNLNHNPYMHMLYKDCEQCEGRGYI